VRHALLLMGHGSRDAHGAREFLDLAAAVRRRAGGAVEAGVLEFAGPVAPSIQEAVDACVSGGAAEVVAQPVLLANGHHEVHDMPAQVAAAASRHPGVRFALGRCLGVDDRLVDVVIDRVAAAGGRSASAGPGAAPGSGMGGARASMSSRDADRETAVLLCGRGSLRPEANTELAAVARRTALALGGPAGAVGWCFISLAEPSLPEALRRSAAPGVRRVVVVPYFLNTGVLVRRIAAQAADALEDVRVVVTPHLGVDRRVIDVILERAAEAARDLAAEAPLSGAPAPVTGP
jgi:sirohydrochlorin cobaltochelatase